MPDDQRQIRAIVRGVERFAAREVVRVTLDVNAELLKVTPVDTGWARANWVPNIAKPFEGTVGSRPRAGGTVSGDGANQAGQAKVAGYGPANLAAGQPVYISNNVPYIERLNDRGATMARNSRGQIAAAGWVQRAISDVVRAL